MNRDGSTSLAPGNSDKAPGTATYKPCGAACTPIALGSAISIWKHCSDRENQARRTLCCASCTASLHGQVLEMTRTVHPGQWGRRVLCQIAGPVSVAWISTGERKWKHYHRHKLLAASC